MWEGHSDAVGGSVRFIPSQDLEENTFYFLLSYCLRNCARD